MNRKLNIKFIPKKLAILLFDMLICPILLYGCEVREPYLDINYDKWYDNPIEKVHTQFLKRLIGVNRNSSNVLVMRELGRLPLQAKAFNNNINYLKYISLKEDTTIVKQAYQYEKSKLGRRTTIENSLNKVNIHYAQSDILANVLTTSRSTLKQKINKLFQEKWRIKLTLSPKADTYKLFKNFPKFEKCFDLVANIKQLNALLKLRVSDHQLMIEKGRRYRPPLARHERLCTVCGVLENEAHFLTICPKFQ